jgi:hypothetical protein
MALLYQVAVSNPNDVNLFPPALSDWQENVLAPFNTNTLHFTGGNSIVYLFSTVEELTAGVNSIKLTADQKAVFEEWKTANSITISVNVYQLSNADSGDYITPY